MIKRNYPPGVHGQRRTARLTEYGKQLREKQKAKRIYCLLEKQFSNFYKMAEKKKGNTADNFYKLLEMRLYNVVYRLEIGKSRNAARELVSHKHILVNGKTVNIPSHLVKVGDEISIRESSKKKKYFVDLKGAMKKETPDWLCFDIKEMKGKVVGEPKLDKEAVGIDFKAIIEFYSR